MGCVGFIPAETESEEAYTTVWTALRKAQHALLYKVQQCPVHECELCSELRRVLSQPKMAAHKDSDDYKRHRLPLHGSLGDQIIGGKNFARNQLGVASGTCLAHATIINKKKGKQRAYFKDKKLHEDWYDSRTQDNWKGKPWNGPWISWTAMLY